MVQGPKHPVSTILLTLAGLMNKGPRGPTFLCFATLKTSGNTFKETS